MKHTLSRRVRFGPFDLDTHTAELCRDGIRVPLQRKPAELLVLLVENHGRELSRTDIRNHLWSNGELIDWDRSLNSAVRKLRRALGDDPDEPRYVLTLPRRGYRFVAELEYAEIFDAARPDGMVPARKRNSPATLLGVATLIVVALLVAFFSRIHTSADSSKPVARTAAGIAVLPFANMSNDPSQDYFSEGLSQEIIDQLASVEGLRVVGRTSSFYFKDHPAPIRDIGRTLGVSHIVEGSVRKDAENVRVTVALVDARSGSPVWSRTFERKLLSVFEIQDEISLEVATAISPRIRESGVGKAAVTDFGAYDLYLLARGRIDQRTRDGLESAREHLENAISKDDDYAPAHVAYAETLALLSDTGSTYGSIPLDQAWALALPHIRRALELDPRQKRAYAVQGLFHRLSGEADLAEAALKRALSIDPNFSPAHLWLALVYEQTDLKKSLSHFETAYELEPLWPTAIFQYARQLEARGRFDEAYLVLERASTYSPDNPTIARAEGNNLWHRGELADAVRRYNQAVDLDPANRLTLNNLTAYQILLHCFTSAEEHLTPNLEPYYFWERGEPAAAAKAANELFTSNPTRPEEIAELAMWEGFAGNEIRVIELLVPFAERDEGVDEILFAGRGEPAALLAHALRSQGRIQEAERIVSALDNRVQYLEEAGFETSGVSVMKAYQAAFEGDADRVLSHMEQAWARGLREPSLGRQPLFDFLDDDPRWLELTNRGLAAISAARVSLRVESESPS